MKNSYVAFAVIILSLQLSGCENDELFKNSLKKWNKSGIRDYSIKVRFSAFSPLAGVWELNVKDGSIINCSFNSKTADDCNKAEMLTMDNLYKIAPDGITGGKNEPFVFEITYDKNGLIKSLAKIKNPKFKNKVKTDSTFKIEVVEFIPAGR